jgi:hypothetical protein
MFAANVFTEELLKLSASWSGAEPTGTQGVDYLLDLSFPDVGSTKN